MRALVAPLFVTALVLAAERKGLALVEKILQMPPATGLVVVDLVPGTQAETKGIRVGDTIVSYAGAETPDLPALMKARQGASQGEAVDCVVVRPDGTRIELRLDAGPIGVRNLVAVKRGEAVAPLPPETGVTFDFSSLSKDGAEEWYAFSLDEGKTKKGFEHSMLSLADGRLTMRREVAFDGGEQWGLNHFDVTVVMDVSDGLRPISTSFLNPITGWLGEGKRTEDGAWEMRIRSSPTEEETRTTALAVDLPAVPSYLMEILACFLPREQGACIHFRVLSEGGGTLGLPTALYVAGEEEIEHEGAKVGVWRVESRSLGSSAGGSYWVDGEQRVVKVDYGGAMGFLTTKEKALDGLHEDLEARTAE